MEFIDKARAAAANAAETVKNAVAENADKIEATIDKAGDFIDEKTGGKFGETIDKVQAAAHGAVDKVQDAAGAAKDAAEGAADKVKDAAEGAADKVKGAAETVADKVDGQK